MDSKLTPEEKKLAKALNSLFEKGGWEIPDDAIVGIYARKIELLEAKVKFLADKLATAHAFSVN